MTSEIAGRPLAEAGSGEPGEMGMEEFFQGVLQGNPFSRNAVSEPGGAPIDVAAIHDRPYQELVGYADEVRRERGRVGQVVWGEAGIGKSHLLARLNHWAETGGRACCVFLHNLQPSPESLPRYLVKCVVHQMIRNRRAGYYDTPLYRLVQGGIRRALGQFPPPDFPPTALQAQGSYRQLVDRMLGENPNAGVEARMVHEALFRYFVGGYRGHRGDGNEHWAPLAVRWLSGDDLDHSEAVELGLPASDDADRLVRLPGAPAMESVLVALAELAWFRGQPFLLCLDQIDNLSAEQMRALSQFLHPLIDHARNLLVVLSGVQRKILDFVEQQAILPAAWERIAQNAQGVQLTRISRAQARHLVEARLEPFFDPFMTLPAVKRRVEQDALFPLGSAWFDDRTWDLVEFRPRDIVNWARDRWREAQARLREQGGQAWLDSWPQDRRDDGQRGRRPEPVELPLGELHQRIDEEIARRIEEQIASRAQEPDSLPADADTLCELVEKLARRCIGRPACRVVAIERSAAGAGRRPVYHLVVTLRNEQGGESMAGVTFVATDSRTSMAATFRRMKEDGDPPHRVLVAYDERLPLDLGPTGEEYREALARRGPDRYGEIGLAFRDYAELDAWQKVIGEASAGDLEVDLPGGWTRRVTEDEAAASLHRQERFGRHRLFGPLLE